MGAVMSRREQESMGEVSLREHKSMEAANRRHVHGDESVDAVVVGHGGDCEHVDDDGGDVGVVGVVGVVVEFEYETLGLRRGPVRSGGCDYDHVSEHEHEHERECGHERDDDGDGHVYVYVYVAAFVVAVVVAQNVVNSAEQFPVHSKAEQQG